MRKNSAVPAALIFVAALSLFVSAVILNRAGRLADSQLTIVSSISALILTAAVMVYAVVALNKTNTERYQEMFENRKE